MKYLSALGPLWETLKTILPLTAILTAFQIFVLKRPLHNVKEFATGFIMAVLGLHFFLKGASMSLLPLGESVGRNLVVIERRWMIVVIAFVIGYFGTLVEPALRILALQVEEVSVGAIPHKLLVHAVAVGFGLGMGIGIFKILMNISYVKIIIPLLVLVIILALLTPEAFVSIAMDTASATTGPVNIPLNMLLAIGLASIIQGADPLLSGFGIVGLTSVGAMVSVMVLGILTKF